MNLPIITVPEIDLAALGVTTVDLADELPALEGVDLPVEMALAEQLRFAPPCGSRASWVPVEPGAGSNSIERHRK